MTIIIMHLIKHGDNRQTQNELLNPPMRDGSGPAIYIYSNRLFASYLAPSWYCDDRTFHGWPARALDAENEKEISSYNVFQ